MATLLEIRQQFIKLSGREDLATTVTDPYDTDAGADYFIWAGTQWLDIKVQHSKSLRVQYVPLAIGEYQADIDGLRAAYRVWKTGGTTRVRLVKKDLDWLVENLEDFEAMDAGTPLYWAPTISSRSPAQEPLGAGEEKESIIVLPPTDKAITLRVFGLFHSLRMTENHHDNYWSLRYPHLLTLASLMVLEGGYRNTTGYNDWRNQIMDWATSIDNDMVWHAEPDVSRMEG
jgi:hypothetical protein